MSDRSFSSKIIINIEHPNQMAEAFEFGFRNAEVGMVPNSLRLVYLVKYLTEIERSEFNRAAACLLPSTLHLLPAKSFHLYPLTCLLFPLSFSTQ
jgi:hypothetical protein